MPFIRQTLTGTSHQFRPRYAVISQKCFDFIVWILHIQFQDIGINRHIRNIKGGIDCSGAHDFMFKGIHVIRFIGNRYISSGINPLCAAKQQ